MAEPMLVANEASKSYGDLVALTPIDLTVQSGELIALVGHNGSGKSTFLRLAAGALELSSGSIDINGAGAGSSAARAATSFIPDDPVLYDDLSVREHLAYVAALTTLNQSYVANGIARARASDVQAYMLGANDIFYASAILFMASDLSSGITGQALDVNCGEYKA